jgi:hypothetical protein
VGVDFLVYDREAISKKWIRVQGKARGGEKRSIHGSCEHFEPRRNAAMGRQTHFSDSF